MSPIAEAVSLASQSFTGQLLQPGDAGYDDRRRVHNGLIDRFPAAIACCHGVADIKSKYDRGNLFRNNVNILPE